MPFILLADDSRSIRQISSSVLQNAGFDVVEVENGAKGYDCARARSFDLIPSDLNMPEMDGITMTRKIRTLANHMKTPILIITTESQMSMKSEAKAAGANGWIVKPVEPNRLVDIVRQVLASRA